jgi:hypothetical protein
MDNISDPTTPAQEETADFATQALAVEAAKQEKAKSTTVPLVRYAFPAEDDYLRNLPACETETTTLFQQLELAEHDLERALNKKDVRSRNDAIKSACAALKVVKQSLLEDPFYAMKADVLHCWNLAAWVKYLIEKRTVAFSDTLKKTTQKKKKPKALPLPDKPPSEKDEGSKWDMVAQKFSVCIPCFDAGRPPHQCIFFGENGVLHHRRGKVTDPTATVMCMCKTPGEDMGGKLEKCTVNGSWQSHPRTTSGGRTGYVIIHMPNITDAARTLKFKKTSFAVQNGDIKYKYEWVPVDVESLIVPSADNDILLLSFVKRAIDEASRNAV